MCHSGKYNTGKTIRFKGGNKHKDAIPYKRERNVRYTDIENYKLNN